MGDHHKSCDPELLIQDHISKLSTNQRVCYTAKTDKHKCFLLDSINVEILIKNTGSNISQLTLEMDESDADLRAFMKRYLTTFVTKSLLDPNINPKECLNTCRSLITFLPRECRDNFYEHLLQFIDACNIEESTTAALEDFRSKLEAADDKEDEHTKELPEENAGQEEAHDVESKEMDSQDESQKDDITEENNTSNNDTESNNTGTDQSDSDQGENDRYYPEELLVVTTVTKNNGVERARYFGFFSSPFAKWIELTTTINYPCAKIVGLAKNGIVLSHLKEEGQEACFVNLPLHGDGQPKRSTPAHDCWVPTYSKTKRCSHHFFITICQSVFCIIPLRCCESHDSIDEYCVKVYSPYRDDWNLFGYLPISENLRSLLHDDQHGFPRLLELQFDAKINSLGTVIIAYGNEGQGTKYDVYILTREDITFKTSGTLTGSGLTSSPRLVAACSRTNIRIVNPDDGSQNVFHGLREVFPSTVDTIKVVDNEMSTVPIEDCYRCRSPRVKPASLTVEDIPFSFIAGSHFAGRFMTLQMEGPYLNSTAIFDEYTFVPVREDEENSEEEGETKWACAEPAISPPLDHGIKQVALLFIPQDMLEDLLERPNVTFQDQRDYSEHGPYHHKLGYTYIQQTSLEKDHTSL